MREACIVVTYKRDDMLFCCLEAIREADADIPIHVFPDRGTDESEVCEKFGVTQHLTLAHTYHGNTANMMEALKWAYHHGAERVFIVEDDAIVTPDFFSWCRKALESHPEAFAACGWQYSPDAIVSDGPDLMMPWYLSVCSCLPRKSVFSIVQHARPEYYSDMLGYLDRTYPNSFRRGSKHYEQDGLCLRVCESESKVCVWPRRPKAVHCGFHGYHMEGKPLEGTLDDRVALLKLALKNPTILKDLMNGAVPPAVARCEKCQKPLLSSNTEARIICVECFHSEHPELPVTSNSLYYLKPEESHA